MSKDKQTPSSEYGPISSMPDSYYGPAPKNEYGLLPSDEQLEPKKPTRPVPQATNPYGVLPERRPPEYNKVPPLQEVPGDLTQQIKAIEAAPTSAAESIYARIPEVLFKGSKENIAMKNAVKEEELQSEKTFGEALREMITLKNLAIALAIAVAAAAVAAACVFAFPAVAGAVAVGAAAVGVSGLSTAALAGVAAGVVGGAAAVVMAGGVLESVAEEVEMSRRSVPQRSAETPPTPAKQQPAMQVNMADLHQQVAPHAAGVVSSKATPSPDGVQQTAVQRLQEQQGKVNSAARQ